MAVKKPAAISYVLKGQAWVVHVYAGEVHLVPVDDSKAHFGVLCQCNTKREDSVVIHTAFDKRDTSFKTITD